jgi:hypothetical protein
MLYNVRSEIFSFRRTPHRHDGGHNFHLSYDTIKNTVGVFPKIRVTYQSYA